MRSLPVARLSYLLADLTVWLAIVVPGIVLGVTAGMWRFGLDLAISPLVVPAMLLVGLTATCIGYAIATLLPQMVTVIVTQALVVLVFMFSPITFPAERLPAWLEAIHRILPVQAMGDVIRGALASNAFAASPGAYLNLVVWCLAGFAITYAALVRRA